MKTILINILLIFLFQSLSAQVTFQKVYGGLCCEWGGAVQETTDGGYIIGGTNEGPDMYLVRVDFNGDLIWSKSYGGTGYDFGNSVRQTTDGGFIIVGRTTSFGSGNNDVYAVKTDVNGDTLWSKTYGGIGDDEGYSVYQTTDGGYIIAGRTNSFGTYDVFLIRTDISGNSLWTKTYGGSLGDKGSLVQQTSDGGYVIVGETSSFGTGANDVYLIKVDSIGNINWSRTYGEAFDERGYSVQQTLDGGYIIVGETQNGSSVYLVKTEANGNALWSKIYGTVDDDNGYSVQQTSDGGYIIGGTIISFGAPHSEAYLIKTNNTGDTLWTKTFGGTGYDVFSAVEETTDGGFVLTGSMGSFGSSYNVYLVKTDVNGNSGCNESSTQTNVTIPGIIVTSPATATTSPSSVDTSPATVIISGGADSTLCTTVGINEFTTTDTLVAFPNPFSTELHIKTGNKTNSEIIFYDIGSRKLLQQKFIGEISIRTDQFARGLYIYRVQDQSGLIINGKILKN
ncbi:MAG: T9SS type A sorting domain-containing protein [Bacteroidetes bacterium]|nr:T9SS type A sorting domain-containing protein [Bacteroidota bacterium]